MSVENECFNKVYVCNFVMNYHEKQQVNNVLFIKLLRL